MHLNGIMLNLLAVLLSVIGIDKINFNYNIPIKDIEILNTFIMNNLDQAITLNLINAQQAIMF